MYMYIHTSVCVQNYILYVHLYVCRIIYRTYICMCAEFTMHIVHQRAFRAIIQILVCTRI